jgi:hypothetical protein
MEGIKIRFNELIINKTSRFVKPSLRLYGEDFVSKISSVFKLAYGLKDVNNPKNYNNHIFILVDASKCRQHFIDTLAWVRLQEYYQDDYAVDSLVNGRLHMIVIKLPDVIDLSKFYKGKYSEMYVNEELIEMLEDNDKAIVKKDSKYKKTFVNKINKYFETTLKETELNSEAELELPPNIDESEIFVNFGV